jgi:hypothetical protein
MPGIYSESDLIVPALTVIFDHPDGITTSELLTLLRRQLRPSGDDIELNNQRRIARLHRKKG